MKVGELSEEVKKVIRWVKSKKFPSTAELKEMHAGETDLLEKIDVLLDEMPDGMDFGTEAGRQLALRPPGDCAGCVGFFLGHSFEARYDDEKDGVNPDEIPRVKDALLIPSDLEAMVSKKKRYVGDVCTRCGATVRRREE